MVKMEIQIPADYPVQPEKPIHCKDPVTCGNCGLTWDDAIVTAMTPAPARCPFEPFHNDTEMGETKRNVNAAAEFWPMEDDEMERPCLVIGGVEVNAYFEGGKLRISVGIGEDVDPEFLKGSTLLCEVTVNGTTVWEAS